MSCSLYISSSRYGIQRNWCNHCLVNIVYLTFLGMLLLGLLDVHPSGGKGEKLECKRGEKQALIHFMN